MKNFLVFLCVGISTVFYMPSSAFAEDAMELQRIIELQQKQMEQQQRQMDAQQKQFEEQRNMLLEMQQRVQGLSGGCGAAAGTSRRKIRSRTIGNGPRTAHGNPHCHKGTKLHPHEMERVFQDRRTRIPGSRLAALQNWM